MQGSNTSLVSLSLTNVHYDPSDSISLACAWLALLPQGLCLVYATLIYSTREFEIALTFLGQLACEALNFVLKRYFKEQRPEVMRALHKGYGMPSSHAQFVSYFAVTVTLFCFFRHSPSVRTRELKGQRTRRKSSVVVVNGQEKPLEQDAGDSSPPISDVYRLQLHHPKLTHTLLSIGTILTAGLVAWSRVYLQYHTRKQVIAGLCAGTVFAVLWFAATEFVRRIGLVQWVLDLDIVRKARIRDLVCEEDLVEIGWQVWEEKRRLRQQPRSKREKVG